MCYTLPKFPEYVRDALDKRDPKCREDSFCKKIVHVLFDDLLQYGMLVLSIHYCLLTFA